MSFRPVAAVVALLAFSCASIAFGEQEKPESVLEGFETPTVAVPYANVKPVIDGMVGDDEWSPAASFAALRTTRGAVSARQTRYWLAWDEECLYLAMRSPFRKGERPVQSFRGEAGDPFVVADDAYEFFFDTAGTLAGGLPAYVQYIGNFAGCKYDAAHLPTVGVRRMAYETGWQPKNRIVESPDGRAWEMEVAIPRESILVKQPLRDGMTIRALLARDYKRPWEQNSIEASSIFFNTATYTRLRLEKGAPAIHLLGVADPLQNTIGLKLQVYGRENGTVRWLFASDTGLRREGDLEVKQGAWASAPTGLDLEDLGDKNSGKHFRIRIVSEDGQDVWLDWGATRKITNAKVLGQAFDDDLGDQVNLSLRLNPVRDYLRVAGDFINYDARNQIQKCLVTVKGADGAELAARDFRIDEHAFVNGVLWLGGLAPGNYRARLVCRRAGGEAMVERETEFTKKDHAKEFPWWNTKHGSLERVVPPWTPVTFDSGMFGVWGRRIEMGAGGLPKSIVTQGRELLAGPVTLLAGAAAGETVAAMSLLATGPRVTEQAEHRVRSLDKGGFSGLGLDYRSNVSVEFDGMHKVELDLDPIRPTTIKSLKIVVPLRPGAADMVSGAGEGIRWGYSYRSLPKDKRGRLWDSRAVDGQRMAAGSFIPYVWLGSPEGGLCWFADTDRGWVPNDTVPAIEVRRDREESIDLVLNLISGEFTLKEPRKIVFAFQATPVKPLPQDWRTRVYDFGDSFQEWQCGDKKGVPRMAAPVPWTFDVERCRKMAKKHRAGNRILSKYRPPVIPYGRHNQVFPRQMPEARYFAEHWQRKGSWHIYYDKTLNDYWIHKLAEWIESCDLDGYYSDNTRPAVCFNVEAGRGYRLPDGRVQPGYNVFGTRRYFLRMRAVFAEHGKQGWIVTHMTHNMVMPWLGACDMALDGEDHHIEPRQNRTWLDAWPLERLRAVLPGALGVSVTFKPEFPPPYRWEEGHRYAFEPVWRSYAGGLLLHDCVPMSGWRLPGTWLVGRDRFAIGSLGVRFLGYWDQENGVRCETAGRYVSGWLRPGRLLLLVLGLQRHGDQKPAAIRIDWQKLGLPKPEEWYVYDAESLGFYSCLDEATGEPTVVNVGRRPGIGLTAEGTLSVTVGRHDYRQIIIQSKSQPIYEPGRP